MIKKIWIKTWLLDQKKYEEDLDKLLEFYNAQGFRDAAINKDSSKIKPNSAGNLNISIKVNEGHKY